MDVRLIPAPIDIEFEEDFGGEEFKREFDSFSEVDDDPVGHWLRLAKARGETIDTDSVLVTLLVELHRKIDYLTEKIEGSTKTKVELEKKARIDYIHHEYFRTHQSAFEKGKRYYGRILMPTFPKRDISVFFEGISETDGKIIMLHERDEKEWSSYVTARERVMIRKMKEKGSRK